MFDDKIKVVYDSINNFIIKKDGRVFSYLLGCLPLLQTLSSDNHSILLLSAGTHAVIYSFKMVEYVLTKDKETISDWDIFMNLKSGTLRYTYCEPVCYQLFSVTENQTNWVNVPILSSIMKFLLKFLKLDVQTSPGYQIMYYFSKSFFIFLILLVILIVRQIMYFLKSC
jgi:hypothetical protein